MGVFGTNSNGLINNLFGKGTSTGSSSISGGILKTGQLLYSDSSITLGTSSTTKITTNIQAPNGYNCHNLAFSLNVTDTTNTTAPSGVNSIESVIERLTITGASGRVLASISGKNGEFERWQHRLNSANQYYVTAPTPADSSASTDYAVSYRFNLKDWIIPNSEFPITISPTYNTLSSRASTLNSMTSKVTSFSIYGDFVPLSSGSPSILRTKLISTATGIIDYGNNIDRALIYDISLDVAADSNLSTSNTFNLAVNNNSLLNNTDYNTLITREDTIYPITTPHIDGFFPFNALVPTTINGNDKVTLSANVSTAPTIGGNSSVVNLYMLEQYA